MRGFFSLSVLPEMTCCETPLPRRKGPSSMQKMPWYRVLVLVTGELAAPTLGGTSATAVSLARSPASSIVCASFGLAYWSGGLKLVTWFMGSLSLITLLASAPWKYRCRNSSEHSCWKRSVPAMPGMMLLRVRLSCARSPRGIPSTV